MDTTAQDKIGMKMNDIGFFVCKMLCYQANEQRTHITKSLYPDEATGDDINNLFNPKREKKREYIVEKKSMNNNEILSRFGCQQITKAIINLSFPTCMLSSFTLPSRIPNRIHTLMQIQ